MSETFSDAVIDNRWIEEWRDDESGSCIRGGLDLIDRKRCTGTSQNVGSTGYSLDGIDGGGRSQKNLYAGDPSFDECVRQGHRLFCARWPPPEGFALLSTAI
jgi:hypothetical protein